MDLHQVVKILYSAASLHGIFFGFLLARSKNNQPANRILATLLFLISFHLILVGFDERSFFMALPHLSRISWIIGTLYWPLLFLFIQKTMGYKLKRLINYLLFIPFIAFLILMLPYYFQSATEKRIILNDFEKASLADFGWINQTISILHIFFQGLALVFFSYIEGKLKQEYSGDELARTKWLKEFLIGILVVTVIAVFSFFARNFNIPIVSDFYHFHFIGLVILFYWVSYKALTYPAVFGLQIAPPPLTVTAKADSALAVRMEAVFNTVRTVLESEKLFLIPTLTLTQLAERAGVHRNVASEAINSQSDGNFFDLVNDYRVEEFKRLVRDPSKRNLSILGIAQESGFNSKATFYSIFKKKTGMTPSEFAETRSELVK